MRADQPFQVTSGDEIKFWIMNWGSNALVLAPESLRNKIKTEAEVMVGKYAESVEKKEKPLTA